MKKLSWFGVFVVLAFAMGCGDDDKNCTPASSAENTSKGGVKAGGGGSLIGVSGSSSETCATDNSSGSGSGSSGQIGVVGASGSSGGSAGTAGVSEGSSGSNAGGGCGELTFEGQCNGATLMWCESGQAYEADCAGASMDCGYVDSQTGYDCVDGSGSSEFSDDEYWGDDDDYWDEE